MDWYYAENGQQVGPVGEDEFKRLLADGTITPDTLVWHEGMAQWQPHRNLQPAAPFSALASPAAADASAVQCAECGRSVPRDQTIAYGSVSVCAECKPAFLQKLKEGVTVVAPGTLRYGGFWVRLLAKVIDNLITSAVTFPINLLIGLTAPGAQQEVLIAVQVLSFLLGLAVSAAYYIFFLGRFGATPGKMIFSLKVVTADGAPISYARATGRFFAEMLSGCPTLTIGYIIAAFDDQKRTLHDHICGTRVVYKN